MAHKNDREQAASSRAGIACFCYWVARRAWPWRPRLLGAQPTVHL